MFKTKGFISFINDKSENRWSKEFSSFISIVPKISPQNDEISKKTSIIISVRNNSKTSPLQKNEK